MCHQKTPAADDLIPAAVRFRPSKKWLAFFIAAHHFGAHQSVLAAPAQPGFAGSRDWRFTLISGPE